jgi:hypothetical protein
VVGAPVPGAVSCQLAWKNARSVKTSKVTGVKSPSRTSTSWADDSANLVAPLLLVICTQTV